MSGLPDEIIKEILSPALKVSDDIFRSTARVSPFSSYEESTSALLVVCKSWLRVSTPLLYHVVVLRSKAQAHALDRALRANNLLGTFVKKLRVEGGFGAPMDHIIRLAPNITDLCLTPSIWSADSVSGLCRGLPGMNPRRIILCDPDDAMTENARTRQLLDVLCRCIGKIWSTLVSVELPYSDIRLQAPHYQSPRVTDICKALTSAPHLTTVILKHPQFRRDFLEYVARNPSLQAVRVALQESTGSGWRDAVGMKISQQFEGSLQPNDKLRKLLRYEYPPSEVDPIEELPHCFPPSFSASFVALQSAPDEVKHKIWDTIIYFSILRDPRLDRMRAEEASFYRISSEHFDKVLRINILLVSKLFRKLARQHFYKYSFIGTECAENHIQDDPSLGSHVRSLFTASHGLDPEALRTIVSHATGLVHLRSPPDPAFLPLSSRRPPPERQTPVLEFQALEALAHAAGSTLETLTGQVIFNIGTSSPKSPAPLYAFTALRTLEWEALVQLEFKPEEVPPDALATLESLSYTYFNDTFLELLRYMSLPALRHVAFLNASKMQGAHEFLQTHGGKLVTLKTDGGLHGSFALCPALSVLYLSGTPCFNAHTSLTKIILTKPPLYKEQTTKKNFKYIGWVNFGTLYPSLQELQVYGCQWPTTEREITKGPRANWVAWSERLMTWNVKLTDQTGKYWKPRLR